VVVVIDYVLLDVLVAVVYCSPRWCLLLFLQ
jgi:hypothetical protein